MKLNESTLPGMYSKALFEEKCLDIAAEHTDKMYDVLFTGAANLLSDIKTKDHPTAFVINNLAGDFLAGSVVQYFPNEDANNPGNWSLVWTFDEKDIPENALRVSFSNAMTHSYFIATAGEKYAIQYKNESSLVNCLTYAASQLKKWLDENAKETEEVTIEMDGFFKARVVVENGEKVFACEPDGLIKALIKDDASIEK